MQQASLQCSHKLQQGSALHSPLGLCLHSYLLAPATRGSECRWWCSLAARAPALTATAQCQPMPLAFVLLMWLQLLLDAVEGSGTKVLQHCCCCSLRQGPCKGNGQAHSCQPPQLACALQAAHELGAKEGKQVDHGR